MWFFTVSDIMQSMANNDEIEATDLKENTEDVFNDLELTIKDLMNSTKNTIDFINQENNLKEIETIRNKIINQNQ